jgi:hypothetical protein
MGPETKNNCAGEDQQQFIVMIFLAIYGVKATKSKAIPVTGRGGP